MYLLTQRWYDPLSGRFSAKDPLSLVGKSFIYCSSNPLAHTDESGLMLDANYCVETFYRCVNTAGVGEAAITVGHVCLAEGIRFGGCAIGCGIIGLIPGSWLVSIGCFMVCYSVSAGVEIGYARHRPVYGIEVESCCDAFR